MAREMIDSGIQWIGMIPAHWSRRKVKTILTANDGGVWGNEPAGNESDKIVIRSTEQTIDGKWCIESPALRDLSNIDYCKSRILKDDLLITKSSGSDSHIGKTTLADEYFDQNECYYSNFLQRIRCLGYSPKLLWYLFNSPIIRAQCVYLQNSTSGIGNINSDIIRNLYIPFPPAQEQTRITAFLDIECTRIDTVIEKTRASIEEYKKLKQSVITQAVTKGIRPGRKMKDSGIEWAKELPEGWTVIPSKYLFRNSDMRRLDNDEQMTASQQYGIITQAQYMELTGAKVVFANKGLEDWKHVEPYDFIISLRSFQGGLEMSETTGCITWHYIVLKPCKPIYSYYFKWLFKSELYIKALQRTCNFIRDGQDLRYSNFVQVPLFEPSLEEQKEIANYLNEKCAEIDTLISKKELLAAELESYKKSLIFEYVTGKKEVI